MGRKENVQAAVEAMVVTQTLTKGLVVLWGLSEAATCERYGNDSRVHLDFVTREVFRTLRSRLIRESFATSVALSCGTGSGRPRAGPWPRHRSSRWW